MRGTQTDARVERECESERRKADQAQTRGRKSGQKRRRAPPAPSEENFKPTVSCVSEIGRGRTRQSIEFTLALAQFGHPHCRPCESTSAAIAACRYFFRVVEATFAPDMTEGTKWTRLPQARASRRGRGPLRKKEKGAFHLGATPAARDGANGIGAKKTVGTGKNRPRRRNHGLISGQNEPAFSQRGAGERPSATARSTV